MAVGIYIISLPNRIERRKKMANRLAGCGPEFRFEFVDALCPEDPEVLRLTDGMDPNHSDLQKELKCTIGRESACFASHLKCLKRIIDSDTDGIVLEDDALLHKDFKTIFADNLFKNETLVMLSSEVIMNEAYVYPGLHPIQNSWTTTAYWISLEYAKEAYNRYNQPFRNFSGRRTSECITMNSRGKLILPQMCLPDPLNLSSLRDTRFDTQLVDYNKRFDKILCLEDYIQNETSEYKIVFKKYFDSINGIQIDKTPVLCDDLELNFYNNLFNRNIDELRKIMSGGEIFWFDKK
jgi:GR25 family glycosyltransferase involved in LPS biosynthesis